MDNFVKEQLGASFKILPSSLFKSFFLGGKKDSTKEIYKKTGGFVKGVCHPTGNYEQIRKAAIEWIRVDVPFPFDKEGNIREDYLEFKKKIGGYSKENIRSMIVTPYPKHFIEAGIDPVKDEKKVAEVAKFLINDLQGYASGIQITNEMGMPHFTKPLTISQAARFIGVQAEAMQKDKGNIIVGYNSAGPQADLHIRMKEYLKYMDYVGIDIYLGCFGNFPCPMWIFPALMRYLWAYTKKPILLQEFGYIGAGAKKSKEEKTAILKKYGVSSEKEAREDIEGFLGKLSEDLAHYVKVTAGDKSKWADFLFKSYGANHLYCELPSIMRIPGYPHTEEGQAKFYKKIIKKLHNLDFVGGMFIYCYSDSESCYICKGTDCPVETKWGLVRQDGTEKPSYYAVKESFESIK